MTETYALLPVGLGYLAFFSAWEGGFRNRMLLLGSGAAFALAMQFRFTAFAPLFALTVGLVEPSGGGGPRRLCPALFLWAGFGLAWSLVVMLMARWGIFDGWFEFAFLGNLRYVGSAAGWPFPRILKVLTRTGPAIPLGLYGTWIVLRRRCDPRLKVLALCLVTDFAAALLSRHWYAHYFVQPLVPVSVLGGWVIADKAPRLEGILQRPGLARVLRQGRSVLAIGAFGSLVGVGLFFQIRYATEVSREWSNPSGVLGSQREAARYIRETTRQGELLLCHGYGPMAALYFLAHRPVAGRYPHHHYPEGKIFGGEKTGVRATAEEYMRGLVREPPAVVVLEKGPRIRLPRRYAEDFHAWLKREYHYDRRIGPFELWRRSSRTGSAAEPALHRRVQGTDGERIEAVDSAPDRANHV